MNQPGSRLVRKKLKLGEVEGERRRRRRRSFSSHAPPRARMTSTDAVEPPQLTPELSLTLRLRFLESLLLPTPSTSPNSPSPSLPPIARRIALVNEQLTQALSTGTGSGGVNGGGTPSAASGAGGATEAVRRFVHNCPFPFLCPLSTPTDLAPTDDLNAPLLSVAPVPFSSAAEGDAQTPQAKVALVLEAENEIRQLERELREIQVLDERGVVGAGKLGGALSNSFLSVLRLVKVHALTIDPLFVADHEALKDDLIALRQATKPVSSSYADLETRTLNLLTSYNDYVRLSILPYCPLHPD